MLDHIITSTTSGSVVATITFDIGDTAQDVLDYCQHYIRDNCFFPVEVTCAGLVVYSTVDLF